MTIDLDLIAQRILKLVDIATDDHLDALERSQAESLFIMMRDAGAGFDGPDAASGMLE
jgi:hypothetical protein